MNTDNRGDYYRTVIRLLRNAFRFRRSRLTGAVPKPEAVSLSLTNRCNSHCIMCHIWQQARETPDIGSLELSGDEITGLLSRPLFSELVELDLTGGEPHLRDDLADIALSLAGLKRSYLPCLKSIIITSNGLLPERIVTNYRKILEGLRDTGMELVSVASLDGIGELHDTIRGTSGAYESAIKTLDGLLELRETYPNYHIGIKTTILPQNIDALDDILDFALERKLFHVISPAFFTEARFRNREKKETLDLRPEDYQKVLKLYSREELRTGYFYSRARDFLNTGRKQWTCTACYNYLFIEFDGTVYPCELLSKSIGNIREQDIDDIWNGSEARRLRKVIGKHSRCRGCIEPGAVRYSAYTEGLSYLGFIRQLGKSEYRETLLNEGYVKYFKD